jgi:GTP cyclohydrolase I
LPFFGKAAIAYIPNTNIVGISKLPRVLEMFSRKLQNQERITNQVAEYLQEKLNPKGVAVSLTARHLCMEMRGVKKQANTTTNKLIGVFKEDLKCRDEFLKAI